MTAGHRCDGGAGRRCAGRARSGRSTRGRRAPTSHEVRLAPTESARTDPPRGDNGRGATSRRCGSITRDRDDRGCGCSPADDGAACGMRRSPADGSSRNAVSRDPPSGRGTYDGLDDFSVTATSLSDRPAAGRLSKGVFGLSSVGERSSLVLPVSRWPRASFWHGMRNRGIPTVVRGSAVTVDHAICVHAAARIRTSPRSVVEVGPHDGVSPVPSVWTADGPTPYVVVAVGRWCRVRTASRTSSNGTADGGCGGPAAGRGQSAAIAEDTWARKHQFRR